MGGAAELWVVDKGRVEPKPGVRPRLLIVEDDSAINEVYLSAFEDDWDVEVFETAEAAIERSDSQRFHLALVDKNLPGMDGLAFMRELRANDDLIGCLMVTGYSNAEASLQATNLRVDAYIEKPWKILDMIGRTQRVLSGRRSFPPREIRLLRHFTGVSIEPVADEAQQRWVAAGLSEEMNEQLVSHVGMRHEVEYIGSTEAAPTLAKNSAPDVVLINLQPADLNRGIVRQLREAAPDSTIVVIAGGLDISHIKTFIELRVAAVLVPRATGFDAELAEVTRVIAGQ